MSKAFTREDDGSAVLRLDDLPQSPHQNFVTASGLSLLDARLEARRADLAALRADSETNDVLHDIAVAERDIRFLKARLQSAILVESKDHTPGVVAFGAEVEFVTDDDTRLTFRIVGEDEADPAQGLIARSSPLAAALMGAEIGSTVEWRKPSGVVDLEIVAIRYP